MPCIPWKNVHAKKRFKETEKEIKSKTNKTVTTIVYEKNYVCAVDYNHNSIMGICYTPCGKTPQPSQAV